MNSEDPYVPADQVVPELSIKAMVLGATLSMILAAANAYLGLFAGMTVSASIPAAVISMAILRFFRNATILENNAVQTAASAGEALAAGVIFTLPALILMDYWDSFPFWQTTLIAITGGILGVLFTIPLRSALIVRQKLKFPEGVATAEVLKTGFEGKSSIKPLAAASAIGALFKLSESGFHLWKGIFDKAALVGNKYFYFGLNLSPALLAVGYIVGLRIASLVFIGGAISWWLAIPIIIGMDGVPAGMENSGAIDIGFAIWNAKIRYLGVGAMVIGGLWALVSIRTALWSAISQGIEAIKNSKKEAEEVIRTEKDTPMKFVFLGIVLLIIPIFLIYYFEIEKFSVTFFMTIFMVIAGFLFSAVAGYMAGLVGSSNNPISGVTIATILTVSLLLLLLMGADSPKGAAAAILIGAVVCCAAAIAGDNMQDLKSGNILGATPRNQQIMQIIGVVAGAVVITPVLTLLNTAYGFGAKTPEHPQALAAPQANLMQSVADGVFGGNLPWDMIGAGVLLGALVIIFDIIQEKRGSDFRTPVLAVAVGLYLPFELDSTIMLGGLLAWFIAYLQNRHPRKSDDWHSKAKLSSDRSGLLFASGLITGEALVGILIAIPVALSGSTDVMALVSKPFGVLPGLLALGLIIWGMIWLAHGAYKNHK